MAKTIPDSRRRLGRRRPENPSQVTKTASMRASRSTGSGSGVPTTPTQGARANMAVQDPEAVWRSKNKRTLAEWDKDDGNYVDLVSSTSRYYDNTLYNILPGFKPGHDKAMANLSEDAYKAIYNYTIGSGKFNIPLRDGVPFKGTENKIKWYTPNPPFNDVDFSITAKDAKRLEKALSRSFKHELDTGIVVARGSDFFPGAIPNVGDLTLNKAYTSTAYGSNDWGSKNSGFNKKVRYVITLPKGSRVLHASGKTNDGRNLSDFGRTEAEILLRKNAVLRTTRVETTPSGQVVVYQDFLGYGSPKKFARRQLKGTTKNVI